MAIEEIKPRDLWSQITAPGRAHRVIPFPRFDDKGESIGDLAIVVLTSEEVELATLHAEKYVREQLIKKGGGIPKSDEMNASYQELRSTQASKEILFRACKQSDDISKPLFKSIQDISKYLTTDEISILMNHYLRVQADLGAVVTNMSQEELDMYVEKLAEGGNAYPLDLLSPVQRTILIMYMADQLWNLRKDNSSLGMLPEKDTSTELKLKE